MATKTVIILQDDIDGTEADETVQFGIDGAQYVIDLNARNAKALRKALANYVKKARKVKKPTRRASAPRPPSS